MKYKLSDLFELQMGKTPSRDNPEYWSQPEFPWISIADLSNADKYIYDTKESLSRQAVEESGIKIIPAQTVIMSFKLSIGKVSITPVPMYSNEAIMAFIDKGIVKIKPEYLYYLLLHRNWDEGTNKAVMGKTLNKAKLSEVVIDIHPIEEQERMVTILDKASEIIDSYQRQLRTLDTLIKARFVEMFGDPETNPMDWPVEPLDALLCVEPQNGLYKPQSDYVQDGTGNFDDEILSMTFHESELENDYLTDYKAKAEYYVRQHQENEAIAKLKSNIPLTEDDVAELERILWSEVGTKQDYEREIGSVPLGEFVRSVIGLDMTAAKAAFADYLDSTQLDSRQIYFVNQIVEYIVHNGMMKDLSVLQDSPFTDQGSIVEVFTDLSVWAGIRKAIERVNANAAVA